MNFKNFYQSGSCRCSFEVFPPKDQLAVEKLLLTLKELRPLNPAFISCTYGAMGSSQDVTRDLVVRIQNELRLPAAFHFTCVGLGQSEIRTYVQHLQNEGVNLVVTLRGDPPDGNEKFIKPSDGFSYANELVTFLKSINGFSIAVAGYPEGHIEAPDLQTDLINLKRKVDAGADLVITQLFFDNAYFFDFVARAKKIGITVPIIPGIMPIINLKQIEKITRMCGATLPEHLHQKLLRHQDDPIQIKEMGIDHSIKQCQDLIARGVKGIHFYILNQAYSAKRILEALA